MRIFQKQSECWNRDVNDRIICDIGRQHSRKLNKMDSTPPAAQWGQTLADIDKISHSSQIYKRYSRNYGIIIPQRAAQLRKSG